MNNQQLSFSDAWQYPSQVERKIPGCEYSETKVTTRKFKSGRDIYRTVFYDVCNDEIESRTSMKLISKRTNEPYYVCQTDAAITRNAAFLRIPPRQPTGASPSGADVVEELMLGLYD